MNKTAYFKHALTGKVDKYPDHFGDLFPDVLVRVDAKDHKCVDCGPKAEPNFEAEFGTGDGDLDQSSSEGIVPTNDEIEAE
jgi:hypothetical protein